ncbi:alpha-2,8-sialyltransferase 8E-like [Ptychodera flava]|uniref:alpha-2,8-sialyltransferase 8E-like n=1 Tax=Ptychodera flava TaxID=63121 RepID=UPI00396A197F
MKIGRKILVNLFCVVGLTSFLIILQVLSNGSIVCVTNVNSMPRARDGEGVSVVDVFHSIDTNWSFNAREADIFRSELEDHCTTSKLFIITQENVKYHGTIGYEAEWLSWKFVTSEIYDRFPKKIPYEKKMFKKCSVVGSGGILLGSKCGKFIDTADFVMRMSFAEVTTYNDDVGLKTDLVTLNPSLLCSNYSGLDERGAVRFKDYAKQQYKNAPVYTSPFSYRGLTTELSFKAHDTLKPENIKVFFAHPDFIYTMRKFYQQKNIKETRVTTGLILITAAVSFCEEVHVYGFWPFSEDPDGKTLNYHYFDAYSYPNYLHNMTAEFKMLVDLHNKGVIRLHVGKCKK